MAERRRDLLGVDRHEHERQRAAREHVARASVAWANVPTFVISEPLPDGIPLGNCVKSIDGTSPCTHLAAERHREVLEVVLGRPGTVLT